MFLTGFFCIFLNVFLHVFLPLASWSSPVKNLHVKGTLQTLQLTANMLLFKYFLLIASEKNNYDSRDISRIKSDDLFVVQFLNAKEGNVDKAYKIMVRLQCLKVKYSKCLLMPS